MGQKMNYCHPVPFIVTQYLPIGVIPNHFNQNFHMTTSELDKTWCVWSTCGKYEKAWLSLTSPDEAVKAPHHMKAHAFFMLYSGIFTFN